MPIAGNAWPCLVRLSIKLIILGRYFFHDRMIGLSSLSLGNLIASCVVGFWVSFGGSYIGTQRLFSLAEIFSLYAGMYS